MSGTFLKFIRTVFAAVLDAVVFFRLHLRSRTVLAAENLFLRKQLALYVERKKKPMRATNSTRFNTRSNVEVLSVEKRNNGRPAQYSHSMASSRISPVLEVEITTRPSSHPRSSPELIAEMAVSNPTWGEERIANELLLKVWIRISLRSVRRYMPAPPPRPVVPSQRWMTFVRNHAKFIIACDFFIVITATFRLVYVFVIMEVGSRRILHFNVTRHPTAAWTLQQFRKCLSGEESYEFVIHDRDRIYSGELDASVQSFGLTVLRTPFRSPQANAYCERLIGSARRECLDFMIPFNEVHVREILKTWTVHYNRGRPHSRLGPGIPEPGSARVEIQTKRHAIAKDHVVVSTSILGGLHHEYKLESMAA